MNYDREAILKAVREADIPQSHWDDFEKRMAEDEAEYEAIARRQYVSPEEMRNTFFTI